MKKHSYNSGIIGNCAYIAHVQKNSNITWMCWPTFEDSFVFGSLLDTQKGGEFSILPVKGIEHSSQFYKENTNVLCTSITSEDGTYLITDFAPRYEEKENYKKPLTLIRKIEPVNSRPEIKITCSPVYDYGQSQFEKSQGSDFICFKNNKIKIQLDTNASIHHILNGFSFLLTKPIYLMLTFGNALEAPLERTAEEMLLRTENYWHTWVKKASIPSFYQKEVIRSALVLKLHQYEDTGAIIAASTTSLPEFPGSERNWDYRYCWVRDSYYVLTALNHIGHFEEMEKFASYIANIAQANQGRLQPLYSIMGNAKLEERTLDFLDGYMGNQPVRVGNQAYEHIQNDVYGQAMIALLPLFTDYRFRHQNVKYARRWTHFILNKIRATIDEKDAGIWEFRNLHYRHCYSNLFQWAGTSAALKIAKQYELKTLEKIAKDVKEKAMEHIEACYDADREVYTHAVGSPSLDASTLQLIMMKYLDPNSEKAKKHLAALEKKLKGKDGLFYRYLHKDDFGRPKSSFLVCAFWYVEALACVGRLDEAQETFKNLLQYGNHLKLFSEDVDEEDGSQWGNFPQAYSHVGLMNAAYRIAIKLDRPAFFDSLHE